MKESLTCPRLVIEGAEMCSDLLYGSGFHPVDPVVFLDAGCGRILVTPMLEYGRAKLESPQCQVVLPDKLGVPPEKLRSPAAWALALLKKEKIKRVQVGAFFPASALRTLETGGIKVDVQAGSLFPERAVKRPKEIIAITQTQRAAATAMRHAAKILAQATIGKGNVLLWNRATVTSERLRREIDAELLRHDCFARDTIVAGGAQAADPHERGKGPLKAGDSIVIDIFPQHKRSGYWGDITRTFCKGPPSPALAAMYKTVRNAQQRALAMIKPGLKGSDVHKMVAEFFEREGYPTTLKNGIPRGFFHGTGHGVGLDIHEAPSLSRTDHVLAVGHVVTVEPGLYDPDIGGVRIEDTVVIEPTGARILVPVPKTFSLR